MEPRVDQISVDVKDESKKPGSQEGPFFVNLEIIKTEREDLKTPQTTDSEGDEDYKVEDDAESSASSTSFPEKVPEDSKLKGKPSCEICGKLFHSNSTLRRHRNTHSSKKPFSCTKCSKSFNRKSSLKDHELTHNAKKPFPCDFCDLSYISKRKLDNHLEKFHNNADKPFKCKICLKRFVSEEALEAHKEKDHYGKRTPCFSCDVCPKTYTKTPLLIKHLKTVHDRAFRCDVCRRSFGTEDEVKNHLLFIPQALACNMCSTSLATKCLLSQHISRMHGMSP